MSETSLVIQAQGQQYGPKGDFDFMKGCFVLGIGFRVSSLFW